MRKAVIFTLVGLFNYGNRLQNYAVHTLLARHGVAAITTALVEEHTGLKAAVHRVVPALGAFRWRQLLGWAWRRQILRLWRFYSFTKSRIPTQLYSGDSASADNHVIVVIGSDQVWNPHSNIGARLDGLQCGNGLQPDKVITLSPSFGVSQLGSADAQRYSEWLGRLSTVSVREKVGALIVKSLTGRDAVVLPDPTMGVTASEWRAISNSRLCRRGEYLLVYSLGDLSEMIRGMIGRFASAGGMSVDELTASSKLFRKAGPSEFLGLVEGAAYLVTDSFHGAVFALLFHTPFAILRREGSEHDMFSRLETLMDMFDCHDRMVSDTAGALPSTPINWGSVDETLLQAREAIDEWLQAELTRVGMTG